MEILNNSSYILLVQTEEVFSQRASLDLKDLGYSPIIVPKLDQALSELKNLQPALMIINPLKNKSETAVFCRKLRETGSTIRILMILASDTVEERSICLEAGADDYLTLPYRSDALVQLVRFYLQPTDTPIEQMQFGELLLDLSNRCLLLKDQKIDLTMKEFELLKYLMANPRQVLTREQILENVWGYDFQGASNVIEVYIRYLRLKIEGEGQKRLIHTVRGVGYVLRDS
jgi:DNA-binding response OmpR family regulator